MTSTPLFHVNDRVMKKSGYKFEGTVQAAFYNKAGRLRYVVEHESIDGLLHIFNPEQLISRTGQHEKSDT